MTTEEDYLRSSYHGVNTMLPLTVTLLFMGK